MTAYRWFGSIVLAAALLAGCDDKKPTEPKVDNKTNSNSSTTTDDVSKGINKAVAPIKSGVNTAADNTKSAATDATKTASNAVTDATKTASNAATDVKAQATEWTNKVEDAIKANKLDEAKTYMDKLETIKSSLPADMQAKLESLRNAYNAAKLKGGNLLGK